MNPRAAVYGVAALLLAALLWVLVALLGSGGVGVAPAGPDAGWRQGPPGAASPPEGASAGARPERALADAPPAPRLVRVLGPGGSPAAGAEVAWAAEEEAAPYESRRQRELRAWRGEVRRTDDAGLAHVPPGGATTVFARRGGAWGWTRVPAATSEPAELRLAVDQTLRAQVLDAAGRALAGVAVSLREHAAAVGVGGDLVATTGAGAGGGAAVAEFAHVQALLPPFWGGRCAVVLDVAGREAVAVMVELAALPDLVTLRMPATGSLRVRLVTDAGPFEPLGTETSAQLFFAGEGEGDAVGARELRVRFPRGELDLPHVGLGLSCRLVMDGAECAGALAFAGPRVAGERVELDLPVIPMPILTGRIVDQVHAPRRGAWTLRQVQDSPGSLHQTFDTGPDGRFVFRLAQSPLPADQSGLLFAAARPRVDEQGFVVVSRDLLHAGRNDLGDIVLGPAPVLVGGRVVDQRGKGVPNARLRVLRTVGDETWGLANVSEQDPHTAADGSFAVRAHALPRELRLLAFSAAHAGEELPFVPPAPHVTYVLPAVGSLTMPLRLGEGIRPMDLWFALRDLATGEWRGRAARHVLAGETFSWPGLLPGHYEFLITTAGTAQPLYRRDDVEIRADEETELATADLGAVQVVTIRVVDGAGQAVGDASLIADPDEVGAPRTALRSVDGTFALPLPRVPVDLLVFAPGHRSTRVPGVRADTTVRLEPGLVVDLRARTTPPLAADARLVPRLRRVAVAAGASPALRLDAHIEAFDPGRDARLWQRDQPLDHEGRARLRVPGAGEYEIVWWLEAYRDFAPIGAPTHRFTVRDGVDPTVVDVEVALPPRRR